MEELNQPTETKNSVIKCNGGGPLGHPVVFLNLGEEGKIVCPYCSKSFVKIDVLKIPLPHKKRSRK